MTPQEWIDSFKQDRNPSTHTIRAYETAFRNFQSFFEAKDISEATEQNIRAYIAVMEAQGNTRITICQRLVPLKCYFKTLHEAGIIQSTPFARIRYTAGAEEVNRQRAETQRKLLTVDQIQQLLQFDWFYVKGTDPDRKRRITRNKLIIHLLCDTGRRVADLCRILREDIDLKGKQIIFNHTKSTTGKGVSPISERTRDLIRKYQDLCADCGNLNGRYAKGFLIDIDENTIRLNIGQAMEVLNMKKEGLNAHAIDHFFISNARERGVQVDELSEITGKSVKTLLKIYNHPGKSRIQQAHKMASVVG